MSSLLNLWELPTPGDLSQLVPALRVHEMIGGTPGLAIFEAEDLPAKRPVSLFVSFRGLAEDDWLALVRPWASLDHPNIHPVHRFGVAGDWPYLVAGPMNGAILRDALADQTWSESRAKTVFLQIAEALRFTHEKGAAHVGLDAECIFVRPDGHVRVSSIGLRAEEGKSLANSRMDDARALRTLGQEIFHAAKAAKLLAALEASALEIPAMENAVLASSQAGRGWFVR